METPTLWTAVALGVALAPGVFAWWSGRRVLQLLDDPALPERLLARQTHIAWALMLAVVLMVFLPGHPMPWGLPIAVVGTAVGGFPARRRLLDEQWGLGGYLLHLARFWGAWFGLYGLLVFAPLVVRLAGPADQAVAVSLVLVLVGWRAMYPSIFLGILGARPLKLDTRFTAIIGRASAPPPRVLRFGFRGGRVAYAFAVPSVLTPAVVFSDTLLDLLDTDEQAAVFAHEVAHLEHYTRRRALVSTVSFALLAALSTLGVLLIQERFWSPVTLWPLLVALILSSTLVRRKAQEVASDRRAVALCGDVEALVRALVKLYAFNRLPRRWGLEVERRATHPSLARRIQALRAAAAGPTMLSGPTVISSKEPGAFVIFEADQVTWLSGVPVDTALDAVTLRQHAATLRTVPYGALVDLRIRAGLRGSPALVAAEQRGASWTIPLRDADVSAVQAILDVVDLTLAPVPPTDRLAALLGRALAATAIALGFVGDSLLTLVIGATGVLVPSGTTMGAIAAVSLGAAVQRTPDLLIGEATVPTVGGLWILSALAAWMAFRLIRHEHQSAVDILPAICCLGLALAVGVWLTWPVAHAIGLVGVGRALRLWPESWIAMLGLGGALLTLQSRKARWGALAAVGAAMVLFVIRRFSH